MKNIIIVVMACILSLMYPECIGDCLLIPHNEQIPIYSDCNKQEIKGYAINDNKTDTFPIIGIFSIDGDMAFIEVDYLMGRPEYVNIEGWIEIKYLGIYLKTPYETHKVYSEPNRDSRVLFHVGDVRWGTYYQVIDAHESWLKIIDVHNPDNVGWLPPESQTTNSYTISC